MSVRKLGSEDQQEQCGVWKAWVPVQQSRRPKARGRACNAPAEKVQDAKDGQPGVHELHRRGSNVQRVGFQLREISGASTQRHARKIAHLSQPTTGGVKEDARSIANLRATNPRPISIRVGPGNAAYRNAKGLTRFLRLSYAPYGLGIAALDSDQWTPGGGDGQQAEVGAWLPQPGCHCPVGHVDAD